MSRLVRRLFDRVFDTPRPARTVRRAFDLRSRLMVQALERRDVPAAPLNTFTVSNYSDGTDPNNPVPGSLRFALAQVNADTADTGANFDAITFNTLGQQFNILRLGGNQFNVARNVDIVGTGVDNLLVTAQSSANVASRVFNISDGTATRINVTISGMEISGGLIDLNSGLSSVNSGDGAAIFTSNENVTLDSLYITGNNVHATNADSGGAIGTGNSGHVFINNSNISGNTATGAGGAIYVYAGTSYVIVTNSSITGNSALSTSRGGGGIYFYGTAATTTLPTTYANGSPASFTSGFTIRNSTISGNSAGGANGGGISMRAFSGNLLVQNSTITQNFAGYNYTNGYGGLGTGSGGGGIAMRTINGAVGSTSQITLQSSIVSGNFSPNTGNSDIAMYYTRLGVTLNVIADHSVIGIQRGVVTKLSSASTANLPFGISAATLGLPAGATDGRGRDLVLTTRWFSFRRQPAQWWTTAPTRPV